MVKTQGAIAGGEGSEPRHRGDGARQSCPWPTAIRVMATNWLIGPRDASRRCGFSGMLLTRVEDSFMGFAGEGAMGGARSGDARSVHAGFTAFHGGGNGLHRRDQTNRRSDAHGAFTTNG